MIDTTTNTSPIDPALVAAIQLLRGAIVPLNVAMERLGWRGNRRAIHARLIAGTLPVRAEKHGRNWFVTAGAVADLLRSGVAPSAPPPPPADPPRRRPGRPRGTTRRASK